MTKVTLTGGPFDGAELLLPGWPSALALLQGDVVHWYVYTDRPPEAQDGHGGTLEHATDESRIRLMERADVLCGAQDEAGAREWGDLCRRTRRAVLDWLRRVMP